MYGPHLDTRYATDIGATHSLIVGTGPRRQRVDASGELAVDSRGAVSRLLQRGSARIRLPRAHGGPPEAVLMNNAGGLTGGDRLAWRIDVAPAATLQVTSAACEKCYRSESGEAQVRVELRVGKGARLDWLPQETILFDGARYARQLQVDLDRDATLLLGESIMLGRRAMGESIASLGFADHWRIRRHGRLLHAESLRIDTSPDRVTPDRVTPDPVSPDRTSPDVSDPLHDSALLAGYRSAGNLLYCSEESEEQGRRLRDRLREAASGLDGLALGISLLPGRLVVRWLARDELCQRRMLQRLLPLLRGVPELPRTWRC